MRWAEAAKLSLTFAGESGKKPVLEGRPANLLGQLWGWVE